MVVGFLKGSVKGGLDNLRVGLVEEGMSGIVYWIFEVRTERTERKVAGKAGR